MSLYQAAAALNANAKWQEIISENLASAPVSGFKKQAVSFDSVESGVLGLSQSQARVTLPSAKVKTVFTPGEMRYTGQSTDVALQGTGFFEVTLANGSTAYTRDGEFHVNAQGQLVTKAGQDVVTDRGTVTFDTKDTTPVTISSTGEISQSGISKGKLKVVDFDNPSQLTSIGGGCFVASDANLSSKTVDSPSMRQGYVETANTTSVAEMTNLISVMRNFEANQKTIQMNDERMGKAISELAGTA